MASGDVNPVDWCQVGRDVAQMVVSATVGCAVSRRRQGGCVGGVFSVGELHAARGYFSGVPAATQSAKSFTWASVRGPPVSGIR